MFEKIWNHCDTTEKLLMFNGRLSDLATKIQNCITALHKLQVSTGVLMDKASVQEICMAVLDIVTSMMDKLDISTEAKSDFNNELAERIIDVLSDENRFGGKAGREVEA